MICSVILVDGKDLRYAQLEIQTWGDATSGSGRQLFSLMFKIIDRACMFFRSGMSTPFPVMDFFGTEGTCAKFMNQLRMELLEEALYEDDQTPRFFFFPTRKNAQFVYTLVFKFLVGDNKYNAKELSQVFGTGPNNRRCYCCYTPKGKMFCNYRQKHRKHLHTCLFSSHGCPLAMCFSKVPR